MPHPALGKRVALEHDVDRLEVEFGGHVAHGAIFVVEMLGRIGALVIALDEVFEHLPMRDHVAAEVHRHEAGKLEEARIHLSPAARIAHRHGRSEEHTSELKSLLRISYAYFFLKK